MADVRSSEDAGLAHREPDPVAPSGPPRWVVVVGIVLVVALLGLIVFLHLSGAIGPGSH